MLTLGLKHSGAESCRRRNHDGGWTVQRRLRIGTASPRIQRTCTRSSQCRKSEAVTAARLN